MYNISALARATYDEKLRAAARGHLTRPAYAPPRAGGRGVSARRLADLRIPRVLRGRRAARAY
jgi:hypothetical protein